MEILNKAEANEKANFFSFINKASLINQIYKLNNGFVIENESENDDSKIINISENLPKQSIKNVVNQENSNENKFAENKPQENDEFVDFLIQELNAKIL